MTGTHRVTVFADQHWDGVQSTLSGPVAVTVEDGKITAVDSGRYHSDGDAPGEVVQLGPRTLLPGLIDCHVHVVDEEYDTETIALQTLQALPALRALLEAGFTTVRDLGCVGDTINVALRTAVEQGTIEGPRLIVAPSILSAPGGHADKMPKLTQRYGVAVGVLAATADQLRNRVREQHRAGADWIKFAASGGFGSPQDTPDQVAFTLAEMTAIVEAADDLGLPCAAHAFSDKAVRRAVQAGVRSIEHACLVDAETLTYVADHDVYLVPTLYPQRYHLDNLDDDEFWAAKAPASRAKYREYAGRLRESAQRLADSDVKLAFGTDAGMFPHADNWREFRTMIDVGITPLRALRAATTVAAELLRRPDLGRIAVGATADLIAVDGDPFTDIDALGRVEFIMQNGDVRSAPAVTLDRAVRVDRGALGAQPSGSDRRTA
ncbi:metal-dependent hydrolase family protein [Nocardia goodfellowii]|uniref:Tryptophan 2-monooxygenase n=1 Tax=Nocardia goodfellowii TaxID=882446 RepID=A0ABS4QN29_9NOCA|nr:amidohydrolase family protein [Nocardia goodfellowii]MBP2193112.1 tryptophan 2-monooxygenase [Nocardia goodfellowii]